MVQTPALWMRTALLPSGWADGVRLRLQGGCIVSVERGVAADARDERHDVAVPGLANVHSHAFQRGMAGLAEVRGPQADDFWTWREAMYRFVDRVDPDDVEALAALAYIEMLESGFTRVGEFHYLHHAPDGTPYTNPAEMAQRIAAAAEATGIGLTLLPVLYAHGGFGGLPPTRGQRRFVNDVDSYARLLDRSRTAVAGLPDAVMGIAPHSLRAVTPSELQAAIALAADAPIHIHAAEQTREVDDCLAWSGQRPVEWLLDHAPVDGRWCLVHATHVTPDEVARLAASLAIAGLCPVTEANLGDGIFAAREYLAAHGRIGIGTDSNVHIDAAGELRLLEYAQRLRHRQRNVLGLDASRSTGRLLFDAAVSGGAQALGLSSTDGSLPGSPGLSVGNAADIVTLQTGHASLAARHGDAQLDSWIFSAGASAIDGVWRRGRQVVRNGRHVARDGIVARYRHTAERIVGGRVSGVPSPNR